MFVIFITELLLFGLLFLASIYLHEAGHLIYIKKYGYGKDGVKFYKGNFIAKFPNTLTKPQQRKIYWGGIFFGLIPILTATYTINFIYFFVFVFLYFYGCRYDFKELKKLY